MLQRKLFGFNMTPRKKLKLDDKKTDENSEQLHLEPPSIAQHLNILPPEILQKIFKYLPPEHLLSIQYSCNSRVAEAAALKKADFRDSKTATEAFVNSFFTSVWNSCLQEIYLPQMIYIDSQTIFNCVSKCKFLTKLNVPYRGLSYIKILHILEKCKALKELHWYVFLNSKTNYKLIKTNHTLQKIVLDVDPSIVNMDICRDLLSRCDTEAEVYLYFSDDFSITWNVKCNESKSHNTNFIVTSCALHFFVVETILPVQFSQADYSYKKEEYQGFCVSASKIYPIYRNATPILPVTPIQTLVLDDVGGKINDDQDLSHYFKIIKEGALKSLKHLSVLNWMKLESNQMDRTPLVCQFLIPEILLNCSNLQEVLIKDIHFEDNCPSLFRLKHLKMLRIPACAITPNMITASKPESHFMEDLVGNCKLMERFYLYSCTSPVCSRSSLTDDDLSHFCKWSNLKHLSLTKIQSLRTCSFLKHVAADTKLTTLCLTDVGHVSVCHYGSNLSYAIKIAHNLKFLKINQKAFNPSISLFWKNIAEIKTLEGLCILTNHDAQVNSSWITDSIKGLNRLFLFHLTSRRVSGCLKKNIRKVMSGHNIQNPIVEIRTDFNFSTFENCELCHFPFIVSPHHHNLEYFSW